MQIYKVLVKERLLPNMPPPFVAELEISDMILLKVRNCYISFSFQIHRTHSV